MDEFSLIARLFAPLAAGAPGALGLKDDAALLDGPAGRQWVITADAMVAGVHFLADDPADFIARKLIRVNLSDLAAMGACPRVVFLAACFPVGVSDDWMERFGSGLKKDCEDFNIALMGGDTVATPGPLTLSLTAIGDVAAGHALLRSNARSGDNIWVSGTIGDAALGLKGLTGKGPADAYLIDRYRLPQPRIALGLGLHGLARAVMDVSDGLVGDLGHICRASGVGAVVEAAKVPLSPPAAAARDLATVLTGGDDYELLFSAPPDATPALEALSGALGLRLSLIGRIIDGVGVTVLGADGQPVSLGTGGYRHFGDQ